MGRLIDVDEIPFFVEEDGAVVAYKADIEQIPSAQPERIKFVQEAVNTILNTSKSDSISDKSFRNAAKFIQNAIDGEPPEFEQIQDEPEQIDSQKEVAKYVTTFSDGYDRGKADAQREPNWIPCSERLPEDLEEVNVTWVNHKPEPYYDFVKDKPFAASAVYYKGDWYWYSSVCTDLLAERGENEIDKIDDAIEITAWKPLPEPWRGEEHD